MALDIMSTNWNAVVVFRKICNLFNAKPIEISDWIDSEMISGWEMEEAWFGRRIFYIMRSFQADSSAGSCKYSNYVYILGDQN